MVIRNCSMIYSYLYQIGIYLILETILAQELQIRQNFRAVEPEPEPNGSGSWVFQGARAGAGAGAAI